MRELEGRREEVEAMTAMRYFLTKQGTNMKRAKVIFFHVCAMCEEKVCSNLLQELQAKEQAFIPTDSPASGHRLGRHPINSTGNLLSISGKLHLSQD